jgi:hypothetical protein
MHEVLQFGGHCEARVLLVVCGPIVVVTVLCCSAHGTNPGHSYSLAGTLISDVIYVIARVCMPGPISVPRSRFQPICLHCISVPIWAAYSIPCQCPCGPQVWWRLL